MKYSIICGHTGIHGSLLNLLDLQDHLIREGNEVDFYCLDIDTLKENIGKTYRNYLIGNLKYISIHDNPIGRKFRKDWNEPPEWIDRKYIHTHDTVLTDFKTLINLEIPIFSNRTVVFDTAELSYHLEGINIDFYPEDIGDLRRIVDNKHSTRFDFLMPPVNLVKFKKKYPDLFSYEYYKKINLDVLQTIDSSDNGEVFYRADEYKDFPRDHGKLPDIEKEFPHVTKLKDMKDMFKYHGFIYYRRGDRAHWEQMGRLIWEFILLDKRVHFYETPTWRKDGLNDYMKYYGHNKEEIIKKMAAPWI